MPLLNMFKKRGLAYAEKRYGPRYGVGTGAGTGAGYGRRAGAGLKRVSKMGPMVLFALGAVLFSFIALVLAMVALFAGASPGMVTDAYIIQLNTSNLGKDVIGKLKVREESEPRLPVVLPVFVSSGVNPTATATPIVEDIEARGIPNPAYTVSANIVDIDARTNMPEPTKVPSAEEVAAELEARQLGDILSKGGDLLDKGTSKLKEATSVVGSAAGAAKTAVNDAANSVVEKISGKLGIKDFYNLHVMDTCNGFFAVGGAYNISNCTVPLQTAQSNVSALLDKELGIGPLKFNLAKLGIVADLQDMLNAIPNTFRALAAAYIAGSGLAAAALLASAAGVVCTLCGGASLETTAPKKLLILTGAPMALAGGSAIALFVGSMVTTLWGGMAVKTINKFGNPIGMFASISVKFQALSWGAFAFIMVTAMLWTLLFLKAFKKHKAAKRTIGGAYGGATSRGIEAGAMSPYPTYGANKEVQYVSGDDLVHSDHHSAAGSIGHAAPPPVLPHHGIRY